MGGSGSGWGVRVDVNEELKFQDDISNMNTYIRTYIHTDKPKPICPLLFQSWGHKYLQNTTIID